MLHKFFSRIDLQFALAVLLLAGWAILDPSAATFGAPLIFGAVRTLKDPLKWTEDMVSGVASSQAKYEDGVRNPRVDVKAATLASADLHKANTLKALNEDRWKKRMEKVDYGKAAEFAAQSSGKLVQGVQDRKGKIQERVTKLHSLLSPHVDKMNAIVVKTDADAEKKMLDNLRGMREIGTKMKEV